MKGNLRQIYQTLSSKKEIVLVKIYLLIYFSSLNKICTMANLMSRASLLAFQASYEHTCSGTVKQTILELCHSASFIALSNGLA